MSKALARVDVGSDLSSYYIGEVGTRPWGEFKVIGAGIEETGQEFCEKEITVNPGQILSLQSHNFRGEKWTVLEGELIVVLDNQRYDLKEGESIIIPLKSIHAMANGSDKPCVVYEKQIGLCSEDDIIRYVDMYGRAPGELDSAAAASVDVYNKVMSEIKKS
ncbi:MAG: phosphomannose isomerase type II C-terminal cupin domain [Alphaproteobacteria bacterium]|nr:phosphomannose isomerase type II C-terminal cupin domain [Alphaproteobacteria bacterium]